MFSKLPSVYRQINYAYILHAHMNAIVRQVIHFGTYFLLDQLQPESHDTLEVDGRVQALVVNPGLASAMYHTNHFDVAMCMATTNQQHNNETPQGILYENNNVPENDQIT